MQRHALFGVNPIAFYDLPPPLPLMPSVHATLPDDDTRSITSSRANSVQPEIDEPRAKPNRRGLRQPRERTNSPAPRTLNTKSTKRDLPPQIMDFLAALPPAPMFDGATFHVDELIKLIRNVNVPYPIGFTVNSKRARGSDDDEGIARGMKRMG
jgi:hypothetical protein